MSKPITIIDADDLFYKVGWRMKDHSGILQDKDRLACTMLDTYLSAIRAKTGADRLIVCISQPDHAPCFRKSIYRFAPYKGTRPEKPEWFYTYESVLRKFLVEQYQAQYVQGLEADDLLVTAAFLCKQNVVPHVMCSPDKDTRQVAGEHLDPMKIEQKILSQGVVTPRQAVFNFTTQMLMGCDNDNVKGLVGIGEVKAQKLLNDWKIRYADKADEDLDLELYDEVYKLYKKQFGDYYGPIIYEETLLALRLVRDLQLARAANSRVLNVTRGQPEEPYYIHEKQYQEFESFVLNQIGDYHEAEQKSIWPSNGAVEHTVGEGEPGAVLPAAVEQHGVDGEPNDQAHAD